MPLRFKKSWLAAKIETTPGTAISLAAADATFRCYNAMIQDTTPYVKLEPQGGAGNRKGSHGARSGECTFDLDLRPKSGAHPAWALAFLPACGVVASTNTYTPRTEFPGSNVKTLTIAKYTDGVYEQIHGAMGNMTFRFSHGEPVMMSCRFVGCYTATTDVALIAPTLGDTLSPLRHVSSALAIGSYTPKTDAIEFDMGNDVVLLPDGRGATGYSFAVVADRNPTIRLTPESGLAAAQGWWADFEAHTERSMSFAHTQDGLGFTFTFPNVEHMDAPQGGERGGTRTDAISLSANCSTDGQDDDYSILLDIAP